MMSHLSNVLSGLLERRGLSQAEAEEITGFRQSYISQLRRGTSGKLPTRHTIGNLLRLAQNEADRQALLSAYLLDQTPEEFRYLIEDQIGKRWKVEETAPDDDVLVPQYMKDLRLLAEGCRENADLQTVVRFLAGTV